MSDERSVILRFPAPTPDRAFIPRLDALLAAARTAWTDAAWTDLLELAGEAHAADDPVAVRLIRRHGIARLVWEDPLTGGCYRRPRGASADAAVLDIVHGHPAAAPLLEEATEAGRQVLARTLALEACAALRERRRIVAGAFDAAVARVGSPDILVLGAGHLREVEIAERMGEVGRLLALERDRESVAEIARAYAGLASVEAMRAGPEHVIGRPRALGRFDLVVAAGVLDDLDDRAAANVALAAFRTLRRGGRLLLSAFAPGFRDAAYLHVLGDWCPRPRDEAALRGVLRDLPREEVAEVRLFRGAGGTMVYADIVRDRVTGGRATG